MSYLGSTRTACGRRRLSLSATQVSVLCPTVGPSLGLVPFGGFGLGERPHLGHGKGREGDPRGAQHQGDAQVHRRLPIEHGRRHEPCRERRAPRARRGRGPVGTLFYERLYHARGGGLGALRVGPELDALAQKVHGLQVDAPLEHVGQEWVRAQEPECGPHGQRPAVGHRHSRVEDAPRALRGRRAPEGRVWEVLALEGLHEIHHHVQLVPRDLQAPGHALVHGIERRHVEALVERKLPGHFRPRDHVHVLLVPRRVGGLQGCGSKGRRRRGAVHEIVDGHGVEGVAPVPEVCQEEEPAAWALTARRADGDELAHAARECPGGGLPRRDVRGRREGPQVVLRPEGEGRPPRAVDAQQPRRNGRAAGRQFVKVEAHPRHGHAETMAGAI
mmetsp:Transcript_13423/g.45478  ORF Transcript_13423/g.45478 Transcript_13423/m.45478 type:complete len:388 (-) Transcript_13423:23-1186(-)